jgi:hypothetical protein
MSATILWRRIDSAGHEAARLLVLPSGSQLAGTAVFAHEAAACRLDYVIVCDAMWRTLSARLTGWIGNRAIDLEIAVDAAHRWRLNGTDSPNVTGCLDIDLAFSPATNLLAIRRLDLKPGEAAPVRAAWLRFPEFALEPLDQLYRRIDATTYEYESGGGAFRTVLRTNAAGFITHYPDQWEVEH